MDQQISRLDTNTDDSDGGEEPGSNKAFSNALEERVAISARSSATALAFTASRSDRTSGTTMHQLRHRTGRSAENPKSSISAICGGCGGFSFIDRQYACARVWERLIDAR
jgi:hypothetical protein